ncbi:Vacuolar protein sorting-associated protein 36 [Auxenochlorella protothecoides]|uniref:Vacuolar protein-sorting-associated protein 36 n=1 Tax=Auxenochlorella protothecoides TaxID=3075 RepID=A0A087SJZ0_AUXPR|nr:Vacuolar protein sorting-associated protein 36 [Auxenochlorella protothecoides]KFM26044.1 Vacuolar protein sorting-associated protein 36 [Auxenochlorella protothecoides]
MRELVGMGFDPTAAAEAVRETGGAGVQHAINWMLDRPNVPAAAPRPDPHPTAGPLGRSPLALSQSTIDQAFQDLSQLMSKAEEMVKLAEYFKERLHQQPGAGAPEAELDAETALDLFDLGLVTPVTKESAGRQYHRELARQLVEVLQGPLQKAGGMLPLPEVYCLYCRVRGSELISPDDLLHALECLPHVQAPMQLRDFTSGLRVVQAASFSDDRLCQRILDILGGEGPAGQPLGQGLSVEDAVAILGTPRALAAEQLELAEGRGLLCRDDAGHGSVVFYRNFFAAL